MHKISILAIQRYTPAKVGELDSGRWGGGPDPAGRRRRTKYSLVATCVLEAWHAINRDTIVRSFECCSFDGNMSRLHDRYKYIYVHMQVVHYYQVGHRCNRLRCPLARMSGLQCFNMGHNGHGINLYGVSMTLMGN